MEINLVKKPMWGEMIWFAQYIDAPEVSQAFGSNLIPTAYNANTSGERVREYLRRKYPDTPIRIID